MAARHVWLIALVAWLTACSSPAADHGDAAVTPGDGSAHVIDAPVSDDGSLTGERDRLLASYLVWLQANPAPQSNGLAGGSLHSVCDLWSALQPSGKSVFLTITHRLYGSELADTTTMLDHVTKLYRLVGGQDASATADGSCGGGEYNRMIMQEDATLHAAQLQANAHQGAQPYDIADVIASGYWRDSHDAGGAHAPFDKSDETNDGAPRGQTQYFADPASAAATAPLGRMDLMTLVDPFALEMDQDYDCTHNSNPSCSYIFYGTACAPASSEPGTQLYSEKYGDFAASYVPTGC
jgi:hypothetical protein